jgi:hypothetical protein
MRVTLLAERGQRAALEFHRTGLAVVIEVVDPQPGQPARGVIEVAWREVVLIILTTIIAGGIGWFHRELASAWSAQVWTPAVRVLMNVAVVVLLVVSGLSLAVWKRERLFSYGACETLFATAAAFLIVMNFGPSGELSKYVALASSLYVLSRGIGNVLDAVHKASPAQLLKLTNAPQSR